MMTRTTMMTRLIGLGIWLAMTGPAAQAQFGFVSGSNGSDGVFNPSADFEVNLSLAATGPWDTTNGGGNGVYDAAQWAIVFKFTTIDIPAGVTVTFKNHPKNPPVVWLAQGDVTIDGAVNLDGKGGSSAAPFAYAQPGPGGFAGGMHRSSQGGASGGFGPTPGQLAVGGGRGVYGYGNSQILPLIGGSGGGGGSHPTVGAKGGGGGGAILIASSSQINFNGSIAANGGAGITTGFRAGGGGGSGGAIRLIANIVSGTGGLRAVGLTGGPSNGGSGRIRVEAADNTLTDAGNPGTSESAAMGPVFPPSGVAATIKVVTIDGEPVPAEPDSGILTVETAMGNPAPVPVVIQATNVPDGTPISVILVPARGAISIQSAAATISGGTATAMVTFPAGRNEIQVRTNW